MLHQSAPLRLCFLRPQPTSPLSKVEQWNVKSFVHGDFKYDFYHSSHSMQITMENV